MTLVSAAMLASRRTTFDEELNHRHLIQLNPYVVPYRETQRIKMILCGSSWFPNKYWWTPLAVALDVLSSIVLFLLL